MTTLSKETDLALYIRLLREAKPFWANIAALFALSLLAAPLALLTPVPLKIVVDSVLGAAALPGWLAWFLPAGITRGEVVVMIAVAGLVVVIALLKQLLDLAFVLLRSSTGERLVLAFRAKLFRHTQGLSLSYHDATGTSDSSYRIQHDAPSIQWIIVDASVEVVSSVATLVAMIAVMVKIDWALALVALAIAPVLYALSKIYSHRLKARWSEAKDLESSMFSVVQEVLSSMRVVKAFAAEDREHERYLARADKNARQQIRLALTGGSFALVVGLAMAAGTAVLLFLATRHVQTGHISLGELILVMSYLALLYSPLETMSKSAANLQSSFVSAARAFQLLDEAPGIEDRPGAKSLGRARGAVAFSNVAFGYNADRLALHDVSFDVPVGACVGIAGTTGAGKSTLLSLLLRFYDPTSGRIELDGTNLRDLKLRDLRNQFAIVLQEPVLFSGSIGENIAYAKPEATQDEIVAAAQAAHAHEFILRLPQGYQTEVGERGVQLSGGERQRISLARAFLKDAPILILDEPTSSVDGKTESIIMEAMTRLMRGRTTFMIAHRLSTLEVCDVRIQLEHGRIVSFTRREPQPIKAEVA